MLMLGLSMQIKAKMIDIKRFVEGPVLKKLMV